MLIERYDARVKQGDLTFDPAQERVLARLEQLSKAIIARENAGFFSRVLKFNAEPRSLYIHGDVGRGKTMLMDLFFETIPLAAKQRIHFHEFMQKVHKERQAGQAIGNVARHLGKHLRLLCLDEMQVNDIADAMLLGRLFQGLLGGGTVVVTTSNAPPAGLYPQGFNRDQFLPTIALIEREFDVILLESHRDYRLGRVKAWESFVTPLGSEADRHIQALWERLTDMARGAPMDVPLLGRSLHVPEAAHGCARFSFDDLCRKPLGAADYLTLAARFKTVFVENIPIIKKPERNEAKRFIMLIDTLYDARVKLVASSAGLPHEIYPQGEHVRDFNRTVSRLEEMQSAGWWEQKIAET